jgi:hypothetical protein
MAIHPMATFLSYIELLATARCGSRLEAAYFVVTRRRAACRLASPQGGGARSGRSTRTRIR